MINHDDDPAEYEDEDGDDDGDDDDDIDHRCSRVALPGDHCDHNHYNGD